MSTHPNRVIELRVIVPTVELRLMGSQLANPDMADTDATQLSCTAASDLPLLMN
jgi:hypothetical protein